MLLFDCVWKHEVNTSEVFCFQKQVTNILQDERFAKMFTDTDYQVDMESEEYRLLNPLVSKLDKDRKKKYDDQLLLNQSKVIVLAKTDS